jgi:hexosaminidase
MVAGFSIYASAQTNAAFVNTLLPEPAKLTVDQGRLQWNSSFSASTPHFHNARLDAAIQRTLRELEDKTGTPLSKEVRTEATGATLVIDVQGAGEAIQSLDENESYSLTVTTSGAKLQAATVVGALRGLQTFRQLLQMEPTGYFLPAVQIEDTPRFRWRGLMIDCGRHFEPVEVIKRTLELVRRPPRARQRARPIHHPSRVRR